MTALRTLEDVTTNEILEVFNLSFADYLVPFQLTKEQLVEKIKSDSISLNLSAGAFENDNLIGFMLHGYDVADNIKIAYNAGTGIIPGKRGNKLTQRLYEFLFPVFIEEKIEKVLLEVITENNRALATYNSIGFKILRTLNCYTGSIKINNVVSELEISELKYYNWQKLQSFWDWKPTWQNSIRAVEILKPNNISISICKEEKMLGYLIFNPKTKRIQQFSVDKDYRNQGIGTQLFSYISSNYGNEISLINIDDTSDVTSKFIAGTGVKKFISQYEMELKLKYSQR